jgi:hypothetical protein
MEKFIENPYLSLYCQDDILFVEYRPEIEINISMAKEIMDYIEEYCANRNFLIFEDMSNIKWIDKKSRDYFGQHPINKKMKAWAYFSDQPIHKIMYTIYKTFSNPQGNSEFFSNKEEAIKWLSDFRN